jgi:glutathione S-transferase
LTLENGESDITQLPQSLAIARYLAREYNLVGENNLDAAKADAIVDTCIDLMTAFYYKVFLVVEQHEKVIFVSYIFLLKLCYLLKKNDSNKKEKALKNFLREDALKGLENVEKLIKSYGLNGYSVGNQLTWADLFIHEITYCLLNYQSDILDKFSSLKRVRSLVEENQNVSNYLKTRKLTPF